MLRGAQKKGDIYIYSAIYLDNFNLSQKRSNDPLSEKHFFMKFSLNKLLTHFPFLTFLWDSLYPLDNHLCELLHSQGDSRKRGRPLVRWGVDLKKAWRKVRLAFWKIETNFLEN